MKRLTPCLAFIVLPLFILGCGSTPQPLPFRVVEATMAKKIDDRGTVGVPLNRTNTFSTQDSQIISHVRLQNLAGEHELRWEWYDPSGNLYHATTGHPIGTREKKYVEEATAWHTISLQREKAHMYLGEWKVNIYLDGGLIESKDFRLSADEGIVTSGHAFKDALTLGFVTDVDVNIPKTNMQNPDAVAVIIGNRNYHHKDVPPVLYAIRDAEVIRRYLITTLGYKEGNIIFEADATKAKFEALFGIAGNHRGTLYDYIKPNRSDVFIYYSGHGAPDPNTKKGYFLPVNCDPAKVTLTAYPLDTFYENLSRIDAKHITVVVDACFSGSTSSGKSLIASASPLCIVVSNPAVAKGNTICLSSSKGDQISSWYDEKQHGLFTYFFLKAIGGAADKNKDNTVTFHELYDYVSDRSEGVPYWARRLHSGRVQTPVLQGGNEHKVLVRY